MNKKICGIVIAKHNSNRFPGKNFAKVEDKPFFMHSVDLMRKAGIEDIYVSTDSFLIDDICKNESVNVIFRGENVSSDNEDYFSVLKWTYKSLLIKYDIIVTVLANSYQHNHVSIINGLEKFEDDYVSEVRSFDMYGNQSGIFMFTHEAIMNKYEMSGHMASIISNGKEIHYKEELK